MRTRADNQARTRLHDAPQRPATACFLARTRLIDRIVPLDDYDVETAAALREHLRVPGMGDTTARYFRDKLAMRVQARDRGLQVLHDRCTEHLREQRSAV